MSGGASYTYAVTEADDLDSAALEITGAGDSFHPVPASVRVDDRWYNLEDWGAFGSPTRGVVLTAKYRRVWPAAYVEYAKSAPTKKE